MAILTAGYVKLAKKWESHKDSALAYHNEYYKEKFYNSDTYELFGVYVDITGKKSIVQRPAMLKLLRDCQLGKVQCIYTQTKGYLAANAQEFCYLIKFLFECNIKIVTEDASYNINTIINEDHQEEALYKMALDFIDLKPLEYRQWYEDIVKAISALEE